jgi:hypothetical protein
MFPESASFHYPEIPVPVLHLSGTGAFGPPQVPNFSAVFISTANGTGSSCSIAAYLNQKGGYELFPIKRAVTASTDLSQPYVDLVREIQGGFGRTFSKLPAVFGVSRQTLYNWRMGETPRSQHESKLVQLAAAARAFSKAGLKPTSSMLDRTVADGKSFLTLLSEGADGTVTAQTLIRIVQRGLDARARLEKALEGGASVRQMEPADFGAPAFKEDV